MECIDLEKGEMAHPLTSFWDLLIEGNSATPLPGRLASDVFICRRWQCLVGGSFFSLSLLKAVIHETVRQLIVPL